MTIKADEKSVYGKKVHDKDPLLLEKLQCGSTDYLENAGERGCSDSEDATGYSSHSLPGKCAARTGDEYCRATGRLSDWRWLLGICTHLLFKVMVLYFTYIPP